MRVLIAPNAFKGSLSGPAAARALARGVRGVLRDARCELMPIADGGDGLIDALRHRLGGRLVSVPVAGPLGERRRASFALLPGRVALIEMARASGLALVPPWRRDVLRATSYGVGELIVAAVRRGAKTVVVGLGGSATNDGGAGMAQALGARLLDAEGRDLPRGAEALLKIASVDDRAARRLLKGVRMIALSDVSNPLCGPQGSARVFGPQKGATPFEVRLLETALARWAKLLARDLGARVARTPGAGAAGGLGAGLLAFGRARILPGADWVLDRLGVDAALARADLALTGEGRLDRTSLLGKAPVALARRARRAGVRCAAVAGSIQDSARPALRRAGLARAVPFSEAGARSPADSLRRAARWAAKAAALAVAGLTLALAPLPAFAAAPDLAAVDQLYWHRDQGDNLIQNMSALDALLATAPQDAGLLWRRGRSLVRRGEKRAKKSERLGDFLAAEDTLKRAVELAPKNAEAHFWLGVTMGRRGETQGVLKSLFLIKPIRREMNAVLELDPSYGGAHRVLGEILWQVPGFAGGDKKKALTEFEAAARLSPRHTANYIPLAEAYRHFGRKDDAIKALKTVLDFKDPDDPADYRDDVADANKLLDKIGR